MRRINVLILLLITAGCATAPVKHIRVQHRVDVRPAEKFSWPVKNPAVLSKFGPRGNSYHTGTDIRGKRGGGDPVYAARAGRVMKVGWVKGYGRLVEILHPDGYKSLYAHLKSARVSLGQTVQSREPLGIVGATGHATTPHVHFEIITPDGYFIDPLLLLNHQE